MQDETALYGAKMMQPGMTAADSEENNLRPQHLEDYIGQEKVKQAVTGYGKAVQKQVQEMTRMLLSLPAVPKPDDTADALAMAITFCHTNGNQLNRFTRRVAGPI